MSNPGNIEIIGGREWSRSRVLFCPWCGVKFFGWTPNDNRLQEFIESPEMGHDGFGGTRETCGDPNCWEKEDTLQANRRQAWRRTNLRPSTVAQPERSGRKV